MNHELICNLKPKSDPTQKSLSRNYPKCEYIFYKNGVYSCRNKNKCDNTQRCLMCKVNKKWGLNKWMISEFQKKCVIY